MITEFGKNSFVRVKGLKERIQEAEKERQMRNYRGLTKEGKWVYGWLVISSSIYYIFTDDNWDYYDEEEMQRAIYGAIEVIPETVGQQTGLKDKNGTEIYEEDLVQEYFSSLKHKGRIQQVVWIQENCCFGLKPSNPYDYTPLQYSDNREVIGNIHQNPELME